MNYEDIPEIDELVTMLICLFLGGELMAIKKLNW